MTTPTKLAVSLLLCASVLVACQAQPRESAAAAPPAASAPAKNPNWKPPPPSPTGPIQCDIDPKNPGPMERGGRARVQLEGPGVSVDASHVPALCGPLYNRNATSLGVVAGDGLLFRTCLSDGVIELSSDERVAGKQPVHAGRVPRGTDLIFAKHLGSSYSTVGAAEDSIVVSADFSKAEATVVLHELEGDGVLRAKVTYDCTVDEGAATSTPAAPTPSAATDPAK